DIAKADATIAITPYKGTYDGAAHGLSGTATGVLKEDLNALLTIDPTRYTNAGSYRLNWSFAGDNNYNSASGSRTIDIAKANATIAITPYKGTYDGAAHGLSGTATGVLGEDLSALLTIDPTKFTNAGSYTLSWSFAGNSNYNSASGTSTVDIAKANPIL